MKISYGIVNTIEENMCNCKGNIWEGVNNINDNKFIAPELRIFEKYLHHPSPNVGCNLCFLNVVTRPPPPPPAMHHKVML